MIASCVITPRERDVFGLVFTRTRAASRARRLERVAARTSTRLRARAQTRARARHVPFAPSRVISSAWKSTARDAPRACERRQSEAVGGKKRLFAEKRFFFHS